MVALHWSTAGGAPLLPQARVTAVESAGVEGDRHSKPGNRRALLLMDEEVLERFGLAAGAVREQVTVRGVDLPRLGLGTRLKVGEAVLEVGAPCAPCELMDEIRPGLRADLDGQRGRFVRVLRGGSFGVGDPVVPESAAP